MSLELDQQTQSFITILIVDNDSAIRRLVEALLSSSGFQTLCAEDGVAALKLAEEFTSPIHLLLTDVVMPKMNGVVLARRFVQQRPESAVLLMTGHATAELPRELPLLAKPFTSEVLLQKVRQVLRPPQVARSARQAVG
jgi:DNA-binding NtrC family response regulator